MLVEKLEDMRLTCIQYLSNQRGPRNSKQKVMLHFCVCLYTLSRRGHVKRRPQNLMKFPPRQKQIRKKKTKKKNHDLLNLRIVLENLRGSSRCNPPGIKIDFVAKRCVICYLKAWTLLIIVA